MVQFFIVSRLSSLRLYWLMHPLWLAYSGGWQHYNVQHTYVQHGGMEQSLWSSAVCTQVLLFLLPGVVGEESGFLAKLPEPAFPNATSRGRLCSFCLGWPRATKGPGGGVASMGGTSSFLESFFFFALGKGSTLELFWALLCTGVPSPADSPAALPAGTTRHKWTGLA